MPAAMRLPFRKRGGRCREAPQQAGLRARFVPARCGPGGGGHKLPYTGTHFQMWSRNAPWISVLKPNLALEEVQCDRIHCLAAQPRTALWIRAAEPSY